MNRLLLVRHASTPATRRAAFAADEALDASGLLQAAGLARFLSSADRVLIAPSRCAKQTAAAAGLTGEIDADLAACDFGAWAGRTLEQIHQEDAAGLRAWRQDPSARPHGGESLDDLVERMRAFLTRIHTSPGRTVAIMDGGLVKAAVIGGLGAPVGMFWSIDVAPASITELHVNGNDAAIESWRLVRSNWIPPMSRPDGHE